RDVSGEHEIIDAVASVGATVPLGPGGARPDWIQVTLVTVDVTGRARVRLRTSRGDGWRLAGADSHGRPGRTHSGHRREARLPGLPVDLEPSEECPAQAGAEEPERPVPGRRGVHPRS